MTPFRAALAVMLTASVLAVRAESAAPLPPQHLSETGLFAAGSTTIVADEVLSFSPQYPLWSDGAVKRRWIALPPGGFIDASRPDAWEFPAGTRLWKEFSVGRRIETRFIERLADGSWRYATYVWAEDGRDATLAPAIGPAPLHVAGTASGRYAIPSETDCRACHEGAPVPALGFSALQLSPDRDPLAPHGEPPRPGDVDLAALVARGLVRNLPVDLIETAPRIAANSPVERAALGYLHGNCGHCHADPATSGAAVPVGTVLAQSAASPSRDAVVQSMLGAPSRFTPPGWDRGARIVAAGDAGRSVLPWRMRSRNPQVQMPPLGTELADRAALTLIELWIDEQPTSKQEETRP